VFDYIPFPISSLIPYRLERNSADNDNIKNYKFVFNLINKMEAFIYVIILIDYLYYIKI